MTSSKSYMYILSFWLIYSLKWDLWWIQCLKPQSVMESVCNLPILDPVVQSIVNLTSSLRDQLVLSVLQIYNQIHWNFLLKKWEKLLHCKSFSHFFNTKYWHIWDINVWNFNVSLTNNVVSFEQPGLGHIVTWDSISQTLTSPSTLSYQTMV